MKRSIGELLFDGYEDTVMELGNSFASEEEEEDDANKIPMDKFGWFYKVFKQYLFNLSNLIKIHLTFFLKQVLSKNSSWLPITS